MQIDNSYQIGNKMVDEHTRSHYGALICIQFYPKYVTLHQIEPSLRDAHIHITFFCHKLVAKYCLVQLFFEKRSFPPPLNTENNLGAHFPRPVVLWAQFSPKTIKFTFAWSYINHKSFIEIGSKLRTESRDVKHEHMHTTLRLCNQGLVMVSMFGGAYGDARMPNWTHRHRTSLPGSPQRVCVVTRGNQ